MNFANISIALFLNVQLKCVRPILKLTYGLIEMTNILNHQVCLHSKLCILDLLLIIKYAYIVNFAF